MNVIIFGGSGFIGRNVVQELHKHGINVTVVCSDIKKAYSILSDSVNIKTFDIFDQDVLKHEIKSFDIAINLIGKLYEKIWGISKNFMLIFHCCLLQIYLLCCVWCICYLF
jgi:nucleoside-diphosphate-sugar epimerase